MSWPIGLEGARALLAGLGLGVAFGFILERAGLGDPKKLVGLFYLRDFTMMKVMFTAIAVTATGIGLLSLLGVVDIADLSVQPTFLWPQLAGGALLGAGFALGGY
ncbi:MAG: YeeE/YedE family protein [Candidatus Rokubacteria bacterium]|nr:YeeE/YedE family protein [Candidatus Rokubacteria bacterium]